MSKSEAFSRSEAPTCAELVGRLGPHASSAIGIDLDDETDATLGEWLIASCLLDPRTPEVRVVAATRSLREHGLAEVDRLAVAGRETVFGLLDAAELPKAESTAVLLQRLSASLRERYDGSPCRLSDGCDSLEELAQRLAALAPGFGRARVARFLRPLREQWSLADELPLDPAAAAAGEHLGLLEEGLDPELGVGRLRRRLAREASGHRDAPSAPTRLRDLEAALERLGRRACARQRVDRCPLGDLCPARAAALPD